MTNTAGAGLLTLGMALLFGLILGLIGYGFGLIPEPANTAAVIVPAAFGVAISVIVGGVLLDGCSRRHWWPWFLNDLALKHRMKVKDAEKLMHEIDY